MFLNSRSLLAQSIKKPISGGLLSKPLALESRLMMGTAGTSLGHSNRSSSSNSPGYRLFTKKIIKDSTHRKELLQAKGILEAENAYVLTLWNNLSVGERADLEKEGKDTFLAEEIRQLKQQVLKEKNQAIEKVRAERVAAEKTIKVLKEQKTRIEREKMLAEKQALQAKAHSKREMEAAMKRAEKLARSKEANKVKQAKLIQQERVKALAEKQAKAAAIKKQREAEAATKTAKKVEAEELKRLKMQTKKYLREKARIEKRLEDTASLGEKRAGAAQKAFDDAKQENLALQSRVEELLLSNIQKEKQVQQLTGAQASLHEKVTQMSNELKSAVQEVQSERHLRLKAEEKLKENQQFAVGTAVSSQLEKLIRKEAEKQYQAEVKAWRLSNNKRRTMKG